MHMKPRLFPTRVQWKKWSLPSKLTAIGDYIGIFSLLFAGYVYFFGSSTDEVKRQAILDEIKSFSDDLEKVQVLVSSNASLSQCVKSSSTENFKEKFENCVRLTKQKYNDADFLVKTNLSSMALLLSAEQFSEISPIAERVRFLIYEMNNNQYIYEHWIDNGCPSSIEIIDQQRADLKSMHEKCPKCTLSVESYPSLLKNRKRAENFVSPIRTDRMTIERAKSFIFPGAQSTIENYFLGMNNKLYSSLLTEIYFLRQKMSTLVIAYG